MTTPPAGDHQSGNTERPGTDADADELTADIAATRERLSETVEALSEKFDVKAQARRAAHEATQSAREKSRDGTAVLGAAATWLSSVVTDRQGKPKPGAVAVGLFTLAAGIVVPTVAIRQGRRRKRPAGSLRQGAGRTRTHRQTGSPDTRPLESSTSRSGWPGASGRRRRHQRRSDDRAGD